MSDSSAPDWNLATQRLCGLDFVSSATIEEVAAAVLAQADLQTGEWRCVVTPNVDHLVRYARSHDEARVASRACVLLPDGMPLVWASRLLGRPLESRLTGSDLFDALWPQLARQRVATVVIAPMQEVADRLGAEHSLLRCVVPRQFDVDDAVAVEEIVDEVVDAVRDIVARVVVIAVSMPKHHLLAAHLERRWSGQMDAPIVLLLGAAPLFYVGLSKRAPAWVGKAGLEWLHRFASEPRRLAKRYFVDDPKFVVLVWRDWRGRLGRPEPINE